MNALIRFAEPKFAIFALIVFSGVLNFSSYYNVSEGLPGYGEYVSSAFDRLVLLAQMGIYGLTLFFLIMRFKTLIRPALRDLFLWGLTALVVSSFIWSDFPYISRTYGIRTLLTTFFGLYLASRFSLKEQVKIIAWALGLVILLSLLYTLALRGAGIEQGFHSGAWRGPLIHKNLFARLMVIATIAPLLEALKGQRQRFMWWGVTGLGVAMVLLSTSKTALVITLTLMILLPFYNALRWSDSILIPVAIALILISGTIATGIVANWDTLLSSLGRDPTLSGRTYIWEAMMHKIMERPWLGYGFKAFWIDGGESGYVWRAVRYKVYQAHNGFYDIGIELGLLGLFFFVLSLAYAYIRAINWIRLGNASEDLWPISYITFLLMYNYTESTIVDAGSIYWILFVSITLSLSRPQIVNLKQRRERMMAQIQARSHFVNSN